MLRLPAVIDRVGLKKTAIYDLIRSDEFPKPVKLGSANAWPEVEIDEWINKRISARDNDIAMEAA
nr:AlpA family phage regulatory protein [Azoarcus sp. L1K30]